MVSQSTDKQRFSWTKIRFYSSYTTYQIQIYFQLAGSTLNVLSFTGTIDKPRSFLQNRNEI